MNFADITDINIPAGDVIKIQDSSGAVLWEKTTDVEFYHSITDVCYSPTKKIFVISGSMTANTLVTNDFRTWTKGNLGNTSYIGGFMCWASHLGKFVMAGNSTRTGILTSSDGINWSRISDISLYAVRDVCYAESLKKIFIVHMTTQSISVSSNGTAWTECNTGIYSTCGCWSTTLKKICLMPNEQSDYSVISTDGVNWTKGVNYHDILGIKITWSSICWSSTLGKFCALGFPYNSTDFLACYAVSSDGVNWTFSKIYEDRGLGERPKFICAPSSLSKFISVMPNVRGIGTSSDGLNWTQINGNFQRSILVYWIDALKKICVIGNVYGIGNANDYYKVFLSSDGINWDEYYIAKKQ